MTSPLQTPRSVIIEIVESIKKVGWVEVVHVDRELHGLAWDLLRSRRDKDWSLVDCASFVVMEQRRLKAVLTTDRHFEQAGFKRMLK